MLPVVPIPLKCADTDIITNMIIDSSKAKPHTARDFSPQPGRPGNPDADLPATRGGSPGSSSGCSPEAQNEDHRRHHHHRSHCRVAEHHARHDPSDMATGADYTQHRSGDRVRGHGNRHIRECSWL